MSAWKTVSALALVTFPLSIFAVTPQCDGTWDPTSGTNWSNSANWNPLTGTCNYPGGTGTSSPGSGIAQFTGNGSGTVTLDAGASPNLFELLFTGNINYTITQPGGGGSFTFSPNGSSTQPSISVNSTHKIQTISAPSDFTGADLLQINTASVSSLLFKGNTAHARGTNIEFLGLTFPEEAGLIIEDTGSITSGLGFMLTGNFTIDGGIFLNASSNAVTAGNIGNDFSCNQIFFNNSSNAAIGNFCVGPSVTGPNAIGTQMTISGPLTIPDMSFLENLNDTNVTAGGIGAKLHIESDVNVQTGGVLISGNANNFSISGNNSIGSQLICDGALTIEHATDTSDPGLINTNEGPVDTDAFGNNTFVTGLVTINSSQGVNDAFQNTNTGTVNSGATGNHFECGNHIQIAGSLLNANQIGGVVNGGTGNEFIVRNGDIILSYPASVTNSNEESVTDGGGCFMGCRGKLTVGSNSNFTNQNSGHITASTGVALGSELLIVNEIIIQGNLINQNSNNVTGVGNEALGSILISESSSVSMSILNQGNVINTNSGIISGSETFGSAIAGIGKLEMQAGSSLQNLRSGSASNGGIQALIEFLEVDILGGILSNGDTVAANTVNVSPEAILQSFDGTFDGQFFTSNTQISNGGTFILGDGIAGPGYSATVNGNYTQTLNDAPGTLVVNIQDVNNYSQLFVTNTADITNGILEVAATGGSADINVGDLFTIIQTGPHTVVGTFDPNIINFNISNLTPFLEYFTDHVVLGFAPALTTYAGGFAQTLLNSVNQINIRLNTELTRLRDQFACRAAWKNTCASQSDNCNARAQQNDQAIMDESCPTKNVRPWNFYTGALGSIGDIKGGHNGVGMDYWSAGALMGFDYAFSHFGIGLVAQYERVTADVDRSWGKINIDEIHASLYGTYSVPTLPEFSFNGIIGGSYELYYIQRNTGSSTRKRVAKGTPHGAELDALFGMQYSFDRNRFESMKGLYIAPLANAQYIYLEVEKYREHEAGMYDMKIQQQHVKSLRSTLGVEIGYNWSGDMVSFTPEVFAGWQREFLDKRRNVKAKSINFEDSFVATSVDGIGRNIGLVGIDLMTMFYNRYGIEASYNFEWNSRYHDHSFYLGFNTRF